LFTSIGYSIVVPKRNGAKEQGTEHRWGIAKCSGEQRRLFSSTPLSLFSSFQGKTAAQEQGPVWRFFFLNLGLMKQTE
jgi:hypothetical protein